MLNETQKVFNIELINTENYLNKDGYYEIDLYPDRKFKGEIYVFFYVKESWGNIHWYKMFHHYDRQNIKVILYTPFSFLPLVKMLCHKVYLEKTSVAAHFYNTNRPPKMSCYGMDKERFCRIYNVEEKGGHIEASPHLQQWLMSDQEAKKIAKHNSRIPCLIDSKEFDNFMKQKNNFGESQIVIESKHRHNGGLRKKWQEKDRVHADHSFQFNLMKKYTKYSYATYQILLSLYCGYAFVGIRGAASLLSMMPVNLIIGTDLANSNFPTFAAVYHDKLNQWYYHVATAGFHHHWEGPGAIEDTWKEQAIEIAMDDYLSKDKHYVPSKNITQFKSVNPKLNFLLDKSS